jgi:hypothetical protein
MMMMMIKWARHESNMEGIKYAMHTKVWSETLKESDYLVELGVGMIILK